MSERYEAIVVTCSSETITRVFHEIKTPLTFTIHQLKPMIFALHRQATRYQPFEPHLLEQIAATISNFSEQALIVFYDNQTEVRSTTLYRAGEKIRIFDLTDEEWVLLDIEGYPQRNSRIYRRDELDPNEEYDIILNAIDAGLEALGVYPDIDARRLKQVLFSAT